LNSHELPTRSRAIITLLVVSQSRGVETERAVCIPLPCFISGKVGILSEGGRRGATSNLNSF